MVDATLYTYATNTKLFTFRYAKSIVLQLAKEGDAVFYTGEVYPEYQDNCGLDGKLRINSTLVATTAGSIDEGYGSIDDQITRLTDIMEANDISNNSHVLLKLVVNWSGDADSTTYYGHFNTINVEVADYNKIAGCAAEFQLATSYWNVVYGSG